MLTKENLSSDFKLVDGALWRNHRKYSNFGEGTAGSGTFTVPDGVTLIHATWSVTGSIVGSFKYQAVTANGPSERDIPVKAGQTISYTVATGGYVRFEWFYG